MRSSAPIIRPTRLRAHSEATRYPLNFEDLHRPNGCADSATAQPRIHALQTNVAELLESASFQTVEARTTELLRELARPSFWDDQERAARSSSGAKTCPGW